VPDCGINRRKRHNSPGIPVIALRAVVCGAGGFGETGDYGRRKKDYPRTFPESPDGMPPHDTLGGVFKSMDKKAFGEMPSPEAGRASGRTRKYARPDRH